MANNSGLGSGFEDFLTAQGGHFTSPQPPAAAQGAQDDQGLFDFLSGQGQTNDNNNKQQIQVETIPEIIPDFSNITLTLVEDTPAPETLPTPSEKLTGHSEPEIIPQSAVSSASPTETNEQLQLSLATESNANTAAMATPQQFLPFGESTKISQTITDPVLKEIYEKFGGTWKLARSDPFGEYLKQIGVGMLCRKLAATGFPVQTFTIEGDEIRISVQSSFHSQHHVFKLNQETNNLVQKEPQSVFCSYTDGKLLLHMSPSNDGFGKVQEVERFINSIGEHVVIYNSGTASCRRYYQRFTVTK